MSAPSRLSWSAPPEGACHCSPPRHVLQSQLKGNTTRVLYRLHHHTTATDWPLLAKKARSVMVHCRRPYAAVCTATSPGVGDKLLPSNPHPHLHAPTVYALGAFVQIRRRRLPPHPAAGSSAPKCPFPPRYADVTQAASAARSYHSPLYALRTDPQRSETSPSRRSRSTGR
jgi:hypothetical protein